MEDFNKLNRKSHIDIGDIYFFTATINNWHKLLIDDTYKQVIIDSLIHLSNKEIISVYGFVIMPNHIHLIWQIHKLNGKETARGSFLKYTAHKFKEILLKNNPAELQQFSVNAHNKKYEFWQRDSLAFKLLKRETAIQKLEYIHNNPVAKKWSLSKTREDYYYSSAKFYETNIPNFEFLRHLLDVF